jgi:uncharacterized protein DUF4307
MASPAVGDDAWRRRYGRRAPMSARRRTLLGLLGVAVLVGLVVAMYVWTKAGSRIQWSVIGYDVRSDTQVAVDFTVAKPAGQPVTCRVVAKDLATVVVGSVDVPVPAAGGDVRRSVLVPTRSRAVLGTVDSCAPTPG